MNPYKSVMSILCKTLAPFDDDNLIPTYGFGDLSSKDHSLVSFDPKGKPIHKLDNVLLAYDSLIGSINLSGPTSFAPAVYKAIETVRKTGGQYHILVIIADGHVRPLTH
jgi:E3 ubiquitin-protein ligase RGLG